MMHYYFTTNHLGHVTIHRSDGATAYLQGEDAISILDELASLKDQHREAVQYILCSYDEIMA